jgi:hypothetical protein
MAYAQDHPSRSTAAPNQVAVLAALSVALFGLMAGWALVDMRQLSDVPVWVKPMKFAASFAVFFITLALVARQLSPAWRNGWTIRITTAVMAVAVILELTYITVMAAQQQASHFNFATSFTATMYGLMGVGAVSLMLGVAVFGIVALRDVDANLGPALRWGIGWGFILSCVLTLVTAGYMSSTGTHVGVQPTGAATFPLMGWSGSVGDVRPSHFLALHAMQALPLAGYWFDRKGFGPQGMRWMATAYVAMTGALFLQALWGYPLVRL